MVGDLTPAIRVAIERARVIADTELFPLAQETDTADLVPRGHLDALRDAGLNGLQGPEGFPGGLAADHGIARLVFSAVAGGCGATAFVWAQHHGAVRRLAGSDGPGRDRWLPSLCDGSLLAGIGFAYLRRPGPPAVHAVPSGSGWRLDGAAPWITGWGLADLFVIMARTDDGSVVTVVVDDPYERPELIPGPRQRLAVMGSTGTVSLRFEGLEIGESSVACVQSPAAWERRDRIGSAMPSAAPLGIAERAIDLLAGKGEISPIAADASFALREELGHRQYGADRMAGALTGVSDNGLEAVLDRGAIERDRVLDLARRATDALVAASGGGAMDLTHPAQRLSREATFFLIQAQTVSLRAASLRRLSHEPPLP